MAEPVTDLRPDPLEGRLAVAPAVAAHALGVSISQIYRLMDKVAPTAPGGFELESYNEGRARRITTRSILAYIERRVGERSAA